MARHILVTMSTPAAGKEDEFDEWYDEHIRELVAVEGWESAQRLKFEGTTFDPDQPPPGPYLAIYEFETDGEPAEVLARATAKSDAGEINFRLDLIDNIVAWVYSPTTEVVTKETLNS